MSENITLKGGISYNRYNHKYVWMAGDDACPECEALDGAEYWYSDEIPDEPHPNCKCYVDVVEIEDEDENDNGNGHGGKGRDNDEPCDCWEEIEALLEELEEIIGDAESLVDEIEAEIDDIESIASEAEDALTEMDETLEILSEEYGKHLPDCENNVDNLCGEISDGINKFIILIKDIHSLLNPLNTLLMATIYFTDEVVKLTITERQGDLDKYRHSVANCNAAQLGILGDKAAEAISDFKEFCRVLDQTRRNIDKEEIKKDVEQHQEANRLGRERGRANPTCDCKILNEDLKDYHKKEDWRRW